MKGKGVTLVEVVVGSIILAVAFGGLLSTFVSSRQYINKANKRLIANDLASQTLNDLYRAVDNGTWDSGDLQLRTNNIGSYTIDNQVYQDGGAARNRYRSSATAGSYRRVEVIVNYPDD
ncbi:MAG: hypothetical protein KAS05_02270 [Candidatus Omnitrophica bacterium]|nr:hypothetical protein [Candidatus Omnitrophota bacterium]